MWKINMNVNELSLVHLWSCNNIFFNTYPNVYHEYTLSGPSSFYRNKNLLCLWVPLRSSTPSQFQVLTFTSSRYMNPPIYVWSKIYMMDRNHFVIAMCDDLYT